MAKMVLTKERIVQIDTILKNRPLHAPILQIIYNQLPQDTTIDNIKIEGKRLTFTLSSESLLPLNTFIDQVITLNNREKYFKTIVLTGLYQDLGLNKFVAVMELNRI
jgi:hypothetical protein